MDKVQYNEIIDFAISKENEAIDFYESIRKLIQFQNKTEIIDEFISMEKGHITILNNLRNLEGKFEKVEKVINLGIVDHIAKPDNYADMDYQGVLELAMKNEDEARNLYLKMSELALDDEVKNTFARLAEEEAKHKLYFEKIYDDEVLSEN